MDYGMFESEGSNECFKNYFTDFFTIFALFRRLFYLCAWFCFMITGVGMPHPVPSRSTREMNVNNMIIHFNSRSVFENVLLCLRGFDAFDNSIFLLNLCAS